MSKLIITSASFEDIAAAHQKIPEFGEILPSVHFEERCQNSPFLALTAFYSDQSAGYSVAYDRYKDGSFYIWMVGVTPEYRQKGIYSALAQETAKWAKDNGFNALRIKTRNNRREMLHWLIKNGFDVMAVDKRQPIADSRIELIKAL